MAAEDDFDDSLLQALDQYERQHAPADGQHVPSSDLNKAAPAPQQQQQRPGTTRQPLQVHAVQHQQALQQQHQWHQHPRQDQHATHAQQQQENAAPQRAKYGTANMQQIWGMFCSGPPPDPNTASCTGWANQRLQKWNNSNKSSLQHKQGQHQQAQHQNSGQTTTQQGLARMQQAPGSNPMQQQQQQWQVQQQPHGAANQPGMPPHQHAQQQHLQAAGILQGQHQHPSSWQQSQPPQQKTWQQQQQVGFHSQQAPTNHQQQQRQQWTQDYQQQHMQQGQPHVHGQASGQGFSGTMLPPVQQPVRQQQQHQQFAGSGAAGAGAVPAAQDAGSSRQAGTAALSGGVAAAHPAAAAGGPAAAGSGDPAHVPGPGAGPSGGPAPAGAVSGGPAAGVLSGGVSGAAAAAACAGGLSGGPAAAAGSGGPAVSGGAPVTYTASLALGRDRQIEVVFSGWHNAIAAVCGSIPGCRRADGNSWGRTWLVPSAKVGELQQKLERDLPNNVKVGKIAPLPDIVRNVLAAADKLPDDSLLYETLTQPPAVLPGVEQGDSLADRLRPFQREGVKFGLRVGGRLLIGDEMGLGKTVQACALAKCYQQEWPVLVVAPSSLRLSWSTALFKWLGVTEDRTLVTLKRSDMDALANARSLQQAQCMYDFVIVSYDMLMDVKDVLMAVEFKVVILDESHCIKNSQAKRTKCAMPLVQNAKRAILLSGTPALSNPSELVTQMQVLLPKAKITKTAFEGRYVQFRPEGKWGPSTFKKAIGGQNEEELNRLLTSTVMIRRKKADVLKDLPAKCRNQVPLLLDSGHRNDLDKLKSTLDEVKALSSSMHGVGAAVGGGLLAGLQEQQRTMIMHLYHATAKIKSKAVTDYVKDLMLNSGEDDKFLVFAYHMDLMDAIEKGVNEVGKKGSRLGYMRIDGKTPAKQRDANVTRFQEDHSCKVAILNIKAAGVGLTLTAASAVVFAELVWTPSEVLQAEDRAHRIGQTQSVNVHFLLVKDSIDDLMWELLQNKLTITGQVLDGEATRMEVQRSSTQQPRGRGAGSGGSRAGAAAQQTQQQPQQPSITSFFAAGAGEAPASKRARSS